MSRISEIVEKLNYLPKGYISKKKIKSKYYNYLQFIDSGKIKSLYIKEKDLPKIQKQLNDRNKLEKELKEILNKGSNLPTLSNNSKSLTGDLMMEDTTVASFVNGSMIYIDEKLCPLFILRTHNLSAFLSLRAIDPGRTNARLLKKVLQIKETDNDMVSLYAHGASITDNYWFRSKGSKLKYRDISFDGDIYSDLALNGELTIYPKQAKYTPQLTATGSYEKAWRKISNKWWLYKKGNNNEIFSELFCSKLAQKLNIPTAIYEQHENCIRTLNFADKYNFEPLVSIASDDDSYENVFSKLYELNHDLAKQYLLLIFFDCLVNNIDRHNENCGLLRNKTNGKIISLAPNFDNNLALISLNKVLNLDAKKDGFINLFAKFIKNNEIARSLFKEIQLPKLNNTIILNCFNEIDIKVDQELISKYLLNRYQYLLEIQRK